MSIPKWSTLFCFVLCLVLISCEKEKIESSAVERQLTIDDQNTKISYDISLADVMVSVEEGMLSFPDVKEYQKALQAISNANHETYNNWIGALGVTTYFSAYSAVVERIAENPDTPIEDQLSSSELAAYIVTSEDVLLPKGNVLDAMMINEDHHVLIGGDLNVFLHDQHILIDEANRNRVVAILARPVTNMAEGIVVTPYDLETNARMQNVDIAGASSCLTTVYGREDSQRFDGTRFKMVANFQSLPTPVNINTSTRTVSVVFRTFISYTNWRRNGLWGWRRTFPNTTFDFGLGDPFVDAPRFDSSLSLELGNPTEFVTTHFASDRAATGFFMAAFNFGNTHTGSAEGSFLFDNFSTSATWAQGQVLLHTNAPYRYHDGGTVRTFWSNRGNQNDPIGARFFCNL